MCAATLVAPWRALLLLLALPQFMLLYALSRLLHESPQWLLAQVTPRPFDLAGTNPLFVAAG